jgi:hypothetical protein
VHSNFDQTKEKSNALNFKRVRETLAIKKWFQKGDLPLAQKTQL